MGTGEAVDFDGLTPTKQLILEVLVARRRLGEHYWPFPSTLKKSLHELAELGLVDVHHGIMPRSVRAALTDKGWNLGSSETYAPRGNRHGGIED